MPYSNDAIVEELTETQRVLLRAAESCERNGWIQGEFGFERGTARCAWGHILEATNSLDEKKAALALFQRTIGMLPRWNDTPGRTQAEVVAALREAAKAG